MIHVEQLRSIDLVSTPSVEKNVLFEAFYHPPFVTSLGIWDLTHVDTNSRESPTDQLLSETQEILASPTAKAILEQLRRLLESSAYITPEFRTWLIEDYKRLMVNGLGIEEDWYGSPWLNEFKGKAGIFSNNSDEVRLIEIGSHIRVSELDGLAAEDYKKMRAAIIEFKEPHGYQDTEIAFARWRIALLASGELSDDDLS